MTGKISNNITLYINKSEKGLNCGTQGSSMIIEYRSVYGSDFANWTSIHIQSMILQIINFNLMQFTDW